MPLYKYDAAGFSITDGVVKAKNKKEAERLARDEASMELVAIDEFSLERIPKKDEADYSF